MAITLQKLTNGNIELVDGILGTTETISQTSKVVKGGSTISIKEPDGNVISFTYEDVTSLLDSSGDPIAKTDLDSVYTTLSTLFFFVS